MRKYNTKEGEDLVNYTKYALKPAEELEMMLQNVDDIFVIACNKCFKEFTVTEEPELNEFVAFAENAGKHITGAVRADFLCNGYNAKKLRITIEDSRACPLLSNLNVY